MKRMKKIASIILALVMVLAMSTAVFADEAEYNITAPDNGHTYEVYQIFTGDFHDGKLSNVKWGANSTGTAGGVVGDAVLDELKVIPETASDTEKLAIITNYADLTGNPAATLPDETALNAKVPTGYYLIKDKDGSVKENDAYTTYIVAVVGDVTISPKSDVPTSDKKVKETNDTADTTSEWQDNPVDYDIGDDVPFQLNGTVSAKYADFASYEYTFHDKLSPGLKFNNDVKVFVDGNKIETGFTVKTEGITDECTFEVVFEDLKKIDAVKAGSRITVEYTAELLDGAVTGGAGNANKMHVEYSNNPHNADNTGVTPDDTVVVFTYKVIANKVTANPDFNKDAEVSVDNPEYIELAGAGFTLFKVVKGKEVQLGDEITGAEMTTFEWKGLDAGSYVLKETTTPAGYNTINPIEFTISTSETGTVVDVKDGEEVIFTADAPAGSLSTDVINNPGSILPSTGGIGTTIFYALGAILVLAAGATLVVRRRMSH